MQVRGLAVAIQDMAQGEDRMAPEHFGTGIAHDDANLFAALGLIAVDGTMRAGGFFGPKPAALEAEGGVIQQTAALGAKFSRGAMMILAIAGDHGGDRLPFMPQSFAYKAGVG